jgi:hypothetical protein
MAERRIVAVELGRSEPARMGTVTLGAGRLFALYLVDADVGVLDHQDDDHQDDEDSDQQD